MKKLLLCFSIVLSVSSYAKNLEDLKSYIIEEYSFEIEQRYKRTLTFARYYEEFVEDDSKFFPLKPDGRRGYYRGHGPYCGSIACFNNNFDESVKIVLSEDLSFFKKAPIESVLFLLCHEVGHGVAGGVKYNRSYLLPWDREIRPYAEGQADFFAVNCMKQAITNGFVSYESFKGKISSDVNEVCKDDNTCKLILQSAKDVYLEVRGQYAEDRKETANFNSPIKKNYESISYLKKDRRIQLSTITSHPNAQCRLDTIKDAYFRNIRSRCWYNPIIPSLEGVQNFFSGENH